MKLVGDLQYIADCTRSDISYAVGRLVAVLAEPTVRHWTILKATLIYLRKTRNYGLYFDKLNHLKELGLSFKT